jgi:hypothetical protein
MHLILSQSKHPCAPPQRVLIDRTVEGIIRYKDSYDIHHVFVMMELLNLPPLGDPEAESPGGF